MDNEKRKVVLVVIRRLSFDTMLTKEEFKELERVINYPSGADIVDTAKKDIEQPDSWIDKAEILQSDWDEA